MNHRILTILIILFGVNFITQVKAGPVPCNMPGCSTGIPFGTKILAVERSKMPASLLGKTFYHSIPKTKNGIGIACGVNAMCASFSTPPTREITAWIGFEHQDENGGVFIATSGEEAFKIDDLNYALTLWDKKHFWITINDNSPPMPIQPRYVATDILTGYEIYVADYLGYKKQNVDYTGFQLGMSVSSLIIEVDPNNGSIQDLYIDYYDENGNFVESIDFNNGDQIVTFFLGLDKISPDTITLFTIEDLTTITQKPELHYEEWYPGITFPCTHCAGLDLSQISFKYIFEAVGDFPRIQFTDPLPIIDEIVFRNSFE
jgi:hypothetical protein